MSVSPRSRPTVLGLDEARYVVVPEGIASSAYPSVKATCARIGLGHDPWQAGMSQCILAKDAYGEYAADTVVMSVCRQVGKTYGIGSLVFSDSIITPGTTTVWTAHRFKVARETFDALRAIALSPLLLPHIDPADIHTAAGNESIRFRNGSRIVFAARERGSVRGVAKVRRLILDEGQILTESAMADLAPTMNQAVNPQVIIMGTPPKPNDPSEVFSTLRAEALDGTSAGVVYIEFSADPESDLDDVAAWRKANPSLGTRTPLKAIQRLRKLLSDGDFAREALGIWDPAVSRGVIPMTFWEQNGDEMSVPADRFALGVEAGPDLACASVSLAGQRPDGAWHVELDENRLGADWLIPYVQSKIEDNPQVRAVVCDIGGPMAALIEKRGAGWALKGTRVAVSPLTVKELAAGCSVMLSGTVTGEVVHINQPQLTAAARVATKRNLGDSGMWVFHRASSVADITPIQSATYALVGAQNLNVKRPGRSSNGERRAVVL